MTCSIIFNLTFKFLKTLLTIIWLLCAVIHWWFHVPAIRAMP